MLILNQDVIWKMLSSFLVVNSWLLHLFVLVRVRIFCLQGNICYDMSNSSRSIQSRKRC